MEKNLIRQGDLLFIPKPEVPSYLNPKPVKTGVIAEGEATGHHHRLAVLEDAQVFTVGHDGLKFLKVGPNGVGIVHEEHNTVNLAPGTIYEVHKAREFDYLAAAARFVQD